MNVDCTGQIIWICINLIRNVRVHIEIFNNFDVIVDETLFLRRNI